MGARTYQIVIDEHALAILRRAKKDLAEMGIAGASYSDAIRHLARLGGVEP